MQNDIGVIEAEAIERGETPQWVAVARRMDEMSARMGALADTVKRLERTLRT